MVVQELATHAYSVSDTPRAFIDPVELTIPIKPLGIVDAMTGEFILEEIAYQRGLSRID